MLPPTPLVPAAASIAQTLARIVSLVPQARDCLFRAVASRVVHATGFQRPLFFR